MIYIFYLFIFFMFWVEIRNLGSYYSQNTKVVQIETRIKSLVHLDPLLSTSCNVFKHTKVYKANARIHRSSTN